MWLSLNKGLVVLLDTPFHVNMNRVVFHPSWIAQPTVVACLPWKGLRLSSNLSYRSCSGMQLLQLECIDCKVLTASLVTWATNDSDFAVHQTLTLSFIMAVNEVITSTLEVCQLVVLIEHRRKTCEVQALPKTSGKTLLQKYCQVQPAFVRPQALLLCWLLLRLPSLVLLQGHHKYFKFTICIIVTPDYDRICHSILFVKWMQKRAHNLLNKWWPFGY